MANPRKFSDKLEIIRRKEEEANAAFVQIMREVSDARKGSPVHATLQPHQPNWIRNHNPNDYMKMRQKYKGGSLPNVNLSPVNPVNLNQKNVTFGDVHFIKENLYAGLADSFGQQQQQQQYGVNVGGGGGGGGGTHARRSGAMEPPAGPIFPSRQNKYRSYTVTSPYRNNNILAQQQQPSLIEEQNVEAPSMWRRTYSDSAIQQSLQLPPKTNTNGTGLLQQSTGGSRIIQTANQPIGHTDRQSFPRSPGSVQFDTGSSHKNNIHIQADTSSLPDLSNLSIPSPIQNPIDADHAEGKANIKREQQQNLFQAPYRIPPRRSTAKQMMYSRPIMSSASDIIETMQREQKPNLNFLQDVVCSSDVTSDTNPQNTHSVSAPLSPVTPPPFGVWNNTPMSPLATGDYLQQPSSAPTSDLQQQLFQIQNESNIRNNGIGNPPPYNLPGDDDGYDGSYCPNNFINNKQNVYRINSGPAHLSSSNSKSICDHQLESALMRVKAQDGAGDLQISEVESVLLHRKANELSQADLNSVRVALDPLDFDDVQMLQDNAQIVDQSAEEQFRLERASYQ